MCGGIDKCGNRMYLALDKNFKMYKSAKGILLSLLMMVFSLQLQAQSSAANQRNPVPTSADQVKPLKKGSKIPAVSLATTEGKVFNLNKFVKQQPAVLVFYRGGWCPYCNTHLRELVEADPELRSLGYQILALSPDKPEKLAESLEKHQLNYTLLSDTAMLAARAFGVAFKVADNTVERYKQNGLDLEEASGENHHLLPVPSVFIIDRKGVVRYMYYNSDIKTRLSAEEIIREAKKAL